MTERGLYGVIWERVEGQRIIIISADGVETEVTAIRLFSITNLLFRTLRNQNLEAIRQETRRDQQVRGCLMVEWEMGRKARLCLQDMTLTMALGLMTKERHLWDRLFARIDLEEADDSHFHQ